MSHLIVDTDDDADVEDDVDINVSDFFNDQQIVYFFNNFFF